MLSKNKLPKLPNLRDGLALSYAAANKGNSNAATKAREAAYTEQSEPLVKSTGNRILMTELPKIQNAVETTNNKPVIENSIVKNDKTKVEKVSSISTVPKNYANTNSKYSTTFFANELSGRNKNNNHQIHDVIAEYDDITKRSKREGITAAHALIKEYAKRWKKVPEYKWSSGDVLYWQIKGGDDFIHEKKLGFIKNYKDVILDAAEKFDIPPILLAGVAYVEFGGAPMWIDDTAYSVRSFDWSGPKWVDENLTLTKNPDLTSFGNTSIQVRRALEMLGYDTSTDKRNAVIESLKDPIQNLYLAACHLNELRNIDFKGKKADELTADEIKIIASRYNLGPDITLNSVVTDYGERIYDNKKDILKSLGV